MHQPTLIEATAAELEAARQLVQNVKRRVERVEKGEDDEIEESDEEDDEEDGDGSNSEDYGFVLGRRAEL